MPIIQRVLFRDKARLYVDYKKNAANMTDPEMSKTYEEVSKVMFQRETNTGEACISEIVNNLSGDTVLEVGCGKGYLTRCMSESKQVTAVDIYIEPELKETQPKVKFLAANIQNLPFEDRQFDTVVCSHTLEHVPDLFRAVNELRRVARRRLIIVVPKQRANRYTFDLHIHFFPYPESLVSLIGVQRNNICRAIDGDLFYMEEIL